MKLLLVDDHALVRAGLARVLRAHWQVGEAGCAAEALQLVERERWDLGVIDAVLGDEDGVELASRLRGRLPLMMLSMHSQPGLVRRALRAGVRAFVLKEALPEEVMAATLAARFGSLYLDARVAPGFLHGSEVEDRQPAILDGLRRGLSNEEIAASVYLSLSSVKSELRQLFARYGVKDRNALLRILHLSL